MLSFEDFTKQMKALLEELLGLETRSQALEQRALRLEDQVESENIQETLRKKIQGA
jgi:hypothetical protein